MLTNKQKIINVTTNYLTELVDRKLNRAFWSWFGSSKIKNGSDPLVLYHGSKNKFDSFDTKKKGSATDSGLRGRGFYFSTNLRTAQSYGQHVYEVYLKIEKPFDMLSFNSLEEIIELLEIDSSIMYERGRGTKFHSISVSSSFSGVFSGAVRELGYDGIIHGQEFVCFDADQIKSVENDGSWDKNDINMFS